MTAVLEKRNYRIPNPKSSPKEIAGSHGHKPAGTSILWPALYRHLRAKGMTKRKAAMISNGLWRKRHGLPPKSPRGVVKIEPTARDVHTLQPLRRTKRKKRKGNKKDRRVNDAYRDDVGKTIPIVKIDEDQQNVFGWAYVTHDVKGKLNVDNSGEFVDDPEEIEKSAYDFVLNSRNGDADHTNVTTSQMIESIVFTPEKIKAMGIAKSVVPVGWWVGFHVDDEDVWDGVKKGRYTSFSIHGAGRKEAIEDEGQTVTKSVSDGRFGGRERLRQRLAGVLKGSVVAPGRHRVSDRISGNRRSSVGKELSRVETYVLGSDFEFRDLVKKDRVKKEMLDSSSDLRIYTQQWGDNKGKICVRHSASEEHMFDNIDDAFTFVRTGKDSEEAEDVSYA